MQFLKEIYDTVEYEVYEISSAVTRLDVALEHQNLDNVSRIWLEQALEKLTRILEA